MARRARPVVGLTTYRQQAAWGVWDREAAVLPVSYVDAVAAAGGAPVLVPPGEGPGTDPEAARRVVAALDALVLAGGGDIDPARYGQAAHPASAGVHGGRDAGELALLEAALDAGLPLLAVCRGVQLLDVHLGGSLVQHLPDTVGHRRHQVEPGCFADVEVVVEPGSRLEKIVGARLTVRCSHHQALDTLGAGLVVSARSHDGVIEAVELEGADFVLGVQWHPEESADLRLFEAVVDAAR